MKTKNVPPPTIAEQIKAESWKIHRCPREYEGPCWGPTEEDKAQAHENINRREKK
jgi:ribosomal protein L37AE/L43A